MNRPRNLVWIAALCLSALTPGARAQWLTQTNSLKPGWNSVFLHVDASYANLNALIASDQFNPIQEVWYWQPALPTGQFVDSPVNPTSAGSQWIQWTRALGVNSPLQKLAGNGAYLVRLAGNLNYDWKVKGKPLLPLNKWSLSGLNFIGFPASPGAPPSWESFLQRAPLLQQTAEIYRYQGGEFGATNPARLFSLRTTPVRRDQAYWIRAGETYNQYFGPFQIVNLDSGGLRFGTTKGQTQFRLRNLANTPIVVTAQQLGSEPPPFGQSPIIDPPPLIVRAGLNTNNLTYAYTNLDAGLSWSLAAAGQVGSEVEIFIGVNRSAMTGNPGDNFAGILRFTDSLGFTRVDMPVSAQKASNAGLWVGSALVEYVGQYLKPYARAANEADFAALLERLQLVEGANGYHYQWDSSSGRVLIFGGPQGKTGSYLLDGPVKVDSGAVAAAYPLRLILHNDGANTKLLQKVFYGVGLGTNVVVATQENRLLATQRATARRISAVHLPASSGNVPWNCAGTLQAGGNLSVTVPLAYDDQSSNPFLHTYHPDHDNLDAQFTSTQPRGVESYTVNRQLTLTFTAPQNDFDSLTASTQDLGGNYAETLTLLGLGANTRTYNVLGTFSLKRISDIATLTTP